MIIFLIVFLILAGVGLLSGLALLIVGVVVWSESSAKKEAKKILASGKIENRKKFENSKPQSRYCSVQPSLVHISSLNINN